MSTTPLLLKLHQLKNNNNNKSINPSTVMTLNYQSLTLFKE